MKKMTTLLMALMLAVGLFFAGCGKNTTEEKNAGDESEKVTDAGEDKTDDDETVADAGETTDNKEDADDTENDDVANALQADGRDYGETFELTTDDVMSCVFFDMNINSIHYTDELEDYVANDGYTFMVVNVTIKNTFDSEIPMSDADFALLWGEEEGTYPDTDFADVLPAEYNIGVNQSKTGNLVYTVPKDVKEFVLEYYDLWDDDFEGNTFNMHINVE